MTNLLPIFIATAEEGTSNRLFSQLLNQINPSALIFYSVLIATRPKLNILKGHQAIHAIIMIVGLLLSSLYQGPIRHPANINITSINSKNIKHSGILPSLSMQIERGILILLICILSVAYIQKHKQLKQRQITIKQLEKAIVRIQIKNTKLKLRPHFLFNALNVLKSGTDDEWARTYTIALSKSYLYLLDGKIDQQTISLQSELNFINSYIHLLKARFQEGINIEIAENIRTLDAKIPPLSLQILIENVLKHNIISENAPITISIEAKDNWLIFKNNIKRKIPLGHPSNHIGLRSIREQYHLISDQNIQVTDNGKFFIVKLPLSLSSSHSLQV